MIVGRGGVLHKVILIIQKYRIIINAKKNNQMIDYNETKLCVFNL